MFKKRGIITFSHPHQKKKIIILIDSLLYQLGIMFSYMC